MRWARYQPSRFDGGGMRRLGMRTANFPVVHGAKGFVSSSVYYQSASGEGVDGSVTMWAAVLCRVDAVTAVTETLFANGAGGASNPGWQIRALSGDIVFNIADGTSTRQQSSGYTLTAGDVGKLHMFLGVYVDGDIQLFAARAQVGTDVAATGYTGIGSGRQITLGARRGGAQAAPSFTIVGAAAGGSTALTGSQPVDYFDAVKTAGAMVSPAYATADSLYNVQRELGAIEDVGLVGDADLDQVGTATLESLSTDWAW